MFEETEHCDLTTVHYIVTVIAGHLNQSLGVC